MLCVRLIGNTEPAEIRQNKYDAWEAAGCPETPKEQRKRERLERQYEKISAEYDDPRDW